MATTTNGIYYPNDYNAAADIPADLKKMAESIDKNIQDNNYDDTEIKQDIQDLKDDVSDIKSKQQTQNDLLQRTQNALINITTPKSSNINVKDSSDLNAKIDVFGISEQETREGYNLFNNTKTISNVTYNSEEDKWVFNLPGKYDHIASKGTFFKNIKANTNYTIYLNILKNTANNIIIFNPDKTIWNTYFNIQAGKTGTIVNNIKTKEDLSTALYDLWFSHPNTITGEFEVQIMLLEGTFTLQNIPNYEQYGASPSPEFPSEIENVIGNIDITVCNKNIFNKENYDALSDYAVQMEGNMSSYKGKLLQLKPNTTYAVSRLINNFDASGSWVLRILDADKVTPLAILQELSYTSDIKVTITTGETGIVYIAELYATDERLQDFFSECEIQIEENNSSTDFIPHKEQTITFPLAEGQKMHKGDYLASDGIHHVKKQVELDGTENWLQFALFNQFYITLNNSKADNNKVSCISTHYKAIAFNTRNSNSDKECAISESGSLAIFSKDYTTISDFKSYLAKQKANSTPVIVEYELAKEEIEPYTPEQQEAYDKLQNVLSYYNETNVFADKALLEFKYIADTQTWVLNKINNTNQQILEIAGGN